MSYLLNGTTIKRPQSMTREPIEISADHLTISGDTKRDIMARKWRYVLEYSHVDTTDASTIYTIYDLKTTVTFQSTETNFPVSLRNVHVDISPRTYGTPGTAYLTDFRLILTEVEGV